MKKISILTSLLILIISSFCFSNTIHVPADQPTIQAGIDAALNGDVVLVAPGTYIDNINFLGKAIIVKSQDGPEATLINGGNALNPDFGSVVLFNNGEGPDSILEGFSLFNGTGTYDDCINQKCHGGGIYCLDSSPMITNNFIYHNTGYYGGGIFCVIRYKSCPEAGYPVITKNTILYNSAEREGGGISCYLGSAEITGNTIIKNSAINGGGIHNTCSNSLISNNLLSGNRASSNGGGIWSEYSHPEIANNKIVENIAESGHGGGIYCTASDAYAEIKGNTILENLAELNGGGICCDESTTLVNNIISKNTAQLGGGVFFSSIILGKSWNLTVTNNTITGNDALQGGGLYVYFCTSNHPIDVANSILWNNNARSGPEIFLREQFSKCTFNISHSTVKGGQDSIFIGNDFILEWGDGMIDADPLFVDSIQNDFHIRFDSPCRESGTHAAPDFPDCDFENDPRIKYGIADMGADEFSPHLYGSGSFTPGGSIKGKVVGLPDTSPVGLFLGSGVRGTPLQHKWGEFYLESPWLLFPLIPIPAGGVLVIPARLPSTPAPYDIPMQALIGWELSNLFVLEVR